MKKSIIYILFALFSFSAAVSLTACKDDGVEISDAYKSKTATSRSRSAGTSSAARHHTLYSSWTAT